MKIYDMMDLPARGVKTEHHDFAFILYLGGNRSTYFLSA
jgi:hypothetical protein